MKVKYTAYMACPQCSYPADYYTTVLSTPHTGHYDCPHCGWEETVQDVLFKELQSFSDNSIVTKE